MSGSTTSRRSGAVDFPTLVVTALASAAAAYVTAQIWAPGTLAAAAFTPVLVALLKEMLFRPVEVVTRAVPVRGVVRSTSSTGEPLDEPPRESPEEIEARIAQLGEAPGATRPGRSRRHWQLAIVTGLLGFIIAAVIITVPELLAGNSVAGGGRDTTLFSGKKRAPSTPTDTTTTTPENTETGPAPAETVTVPPPAETITVPPPAPAPVPEAREAAPLPQETTPEEPATPETTPPAPPG